METPKFYNIYGDEIEVATCTSCFHDVDITSLRCLELNGIHYIDTSSLNVVDSIMENAIQPCCDKPSYIYKKHVHWM